MRKQCENCGGQGVDPSDGLYGGNGELLCSVCGGDGYIEEVESE